MNPVHPDRQAIRKMWRRTLLGAVAAAASTAAATSLAPLLAPWLPWIIVAPLGAALTAAVCAPLLWHTAASLLRVANLPERVRAEQIVASASEGILIINKHGQIQSLNPAAEQFFGYRAAEVHNEPITMLIADAPQNDRHSMLHDTLPVGTILGLATGAREVIGKKKNGEVFSLELTGSNITIDGEPVSIAFARDISKRKRAQRYLVAHYAATCILAEADSLGEALPRMLQAVCEALRWDAAAYWQIDAADRAPRCVEVQHNSLVNVTINDFAGCKLPGRVCTARTVQWSEDISGAGSGSCKTTAPPRPVPPPELHGAFAVPVMRGDQICGIMSFYSRRKERRDEQLLDVMTELSKQLSHFVARKHNEEQLRETTQTLQALVQAAPVAINVVDLQGIVRLWNPAAERMLGWSANEVLGQASPLPATLSGHNSNAQRQSHSGLPVTCSTKEGATVEVSLSSAPLRDDSGTIFGAVNILVDLTDQKQLEAQLRQAQKMEAVGQLAGGVAHDFNNLLTVITGYAEVVLGELNAGSPVRGYLEEIHRAGERAASLTRQLLAFGRKQLLNVQVLDLNEIVQDMSKMLRRLIGEDIEMILQLDAGLGPVKADPSQIEQILLNLAANGRDAMPDGGGFSLSTFNVDLKEELLPPELDPGSYAMLVVSDTGLGMPERVKSRIFEPFFTTKEVGKGTGLGLATVYGIVKQSGGHIEVESEVGRGTTFRIYLPRVQDEAAAGDAGEPSVHVQRGNETLLLVEDEAPVRKLVHHALELNGYKVLQAGSGPEALRLWEEHPGKIDLLVTDVIMPQMNGRQLAEKALGLQQDLRVLFISGYTDRILDMQRDFPRGTWFLSKPITPNMLARKIREVLDAPQGNCN